MLISSETRTRLEKNRSPQSHQSITHVAPSLIINPQCSSGAAHLDILTTRRCPKMKLTASASESYRTPKPSPACLSTKPAPPHSRSCPQTSHRHPLWPDRKTTQVGSAGWGASGKGEEMQRVKKVKSLKFAVEPLLASLNPLACMGYVAQIQITPPLCNFEDASDNSW